MTDLTRFVIEVGSDINDQPTAWVVHVGCDRPIGGRELILDPGQPYTVAEMLANIEEHDVLHREPE